MSRSTVRDFSRSGCCKKKVSSVQHHGQRWLLLCAAVLSTPVWNYFEFCCKPGAEVWASAPTQRVGLSHSELPLQCFWLGVVFHFKSAFSTYVACKPIWRLAAFFFFLITKQLNKRDWIFRSADISFWQIFNFTTCLQSSLEVFSHHWRIRTGWILHKKGLNPQVYPKPHFLLLGAQGVLT